MIEFLKFSNSNLKNSLPEKSQGNVNTLMKEQMDLLHDYNSLKDIGQIIIGKIAEITATTTKQVYDRMGLNVSD